MTNIMEETFGEAISTRTRVQAIENEVLVNLMQNDIADFAHQHCKFPLACTAAVFDIMQKAIENPQYCNDYAEIMHDMLWMSKVFKWSEIGK